MKTSLSRWAVLLVLSGIISLSSGCAWSIGDGKERNTAVAQPTRGQELIDLKKARDQGAISEADYEAQKNKIMEK